jgi:3-deoxy-7-phosphoheptulonate synthase
MKIAEGEEVAHEPAGAAAEAGPRRTLAPAGITRVVDASKPYRKASWASRGEPTVVELSNGTRIGGRDVVIMAGLPVSGPEAQVVEAAHRLRAAGAAVLHGGTLRPPRSPYVRARRGEDALHSLDRARAETGMAIAAEAADIESALLLAHRVDILQVGAENMQNYPFLSRVARLGKPVLLLRGQTAGLTELLLAAEYVLAEGNADVILCEAGVLGIPPEGRPLLDLTAIPVLKSLSHLPVMAAPGATPSMACAAIAAGADGVVLEPAGGDAEHEFAERMERARRVTAAMGRRLA